MTVYSETIHLKDEVSDSAKKASDSVEGLASKLGNIQAGLAEATGGLSLVVEAALGAAAAFGVLTVAGAAFAIKSSEAKQAALSLWDALGGGKISGEEVDELLDNLREKTGLTKDSLGKLTEQFLRMGVTGTDALESLTIAAVSAEALAKGGGAAFAKLEAQAKAAAETGSKLTIPFKKLQSQLQGVGLNIGDLATQMGISEAALTAGFKAGTIDAKKFGEALEAAVTKKGVGPLKQLSNSVANLGGLLEEYIGDLFEDLGPAIAPFLEQVKDLFQVLSGANPSGQALKQGIEGFFKRVFAIATKVVPLIKHFMLDLIIYALKAGIFLKPIVKHFQELAQNATFLKVVSFLVNGLKVAFIAIGVALAVVVGVFLAGVAVATLLGVTIWSLVGIIGSFVADTVASIIGWGSSVVSSIYDTMSQVYETLSGWATSAYDAAANFIQGLVSGITNGAGLVVDAVKGIAGSAVDAFKGALGINSPSKVMMQLGGHTGEGFAKGLESKVPDIHGTAQGMAGSAAIGASSAPATSSISNNNSKSVNVVVEPGAIIINGSGSTMELTEEAISLVWERVALGAGL